LETANVRLVATDSSAAQVARYLGIDGAGISGGAAVEQAARSATQAVSFRAPMAKRRDCNFSFSGLKTQVRCVPMARMVQLHSDT
jgi:tRNA A37 threonylcarbamoyltransferase TsaD